MKLCQNSSSVLSCDVFRYAFHPEDFDVEACTIWEGIVDGGEVLFVDLTHVHA